MKFRTFLLYTISAFSILDIYLGFCHKFNRSFIIYENTLCKECGECYKKLTSTGGYVTRVASIETLLLLMTIFMVIVARFTYQAIKKDKPSRQTDALICLFSLLQTNIVVFAVGSFLQDGGWKLAKEMIRMMEDHTLCDGFTNRSTNRFFLSFGLILVETFLSFIICICSQLLLLFGVYGRNDRVGTGDPERTTDDVAVETGEAEKLFSYVE